MATSELVSLLRTDLADMEAERFTDEVLTRCILKSVFPVSRDLAVQISTSGGEISPEPQGETLEMLLLQAQVEACRFMRIATANAFSFSSGDKRVDKTSQPQNWAKLENDLLAAYKQRLHEIHPGAGASDDYILKPEPFTPVIYEQGLDLETVI